MTNTTRPLLVRGTLTTGWCPHPGDGVRRGAAHRPGRRLRAIAKPTALVVAGLIVGIGAISAAQAVSGDDSASPAGARAFDPSGETDGNGFDGHGLPPASTGGPSPAEPAVASRANST